MVALQKFTNLIQLFAYFKDALFVRNQMLQKLDKNINKKQNQNERF